MTFLELSTVEVGTPLYRKDAYICTNIDMHLDFPLTDQLIDDRSDSG